MLARVCMAENAGVAGYVEAFRYVQSGYAGENTVQVFKNRYTRLENVSALLRSVLSKHPPDV